MRHKLWYRKAAYLIICHALFSFSIAQTKKETIDWLNSKFPKNPIVYGDGFKFSQRMKIDPNGTFEITNESYETPINPLNPIVETTTILKGAFKDLNPASVVIHKQNGLYFIDINCFISKDCIHISQSGKGGIKFDKSGIIFGAYYSNESNIGERLKKAFTRLILLCGGKRELY
jgi:hypothetical protein